MWVLLHYNTQHLWICYCGLWGHVNTNVKLWNCLKMTLKVKKSFIQVVQGILRPLSPCVWPVKGFQPKTGPLLRLFGFTFMFKTSLDCSERQQLSSKVMSKARTEALAIVPVHFPCPAALSHAETHVCPCIHAGLKPELLSAASYHHTKRWELSQVLEEACPPSPRSSKSSLRPKLVFQCSFGC